MPEFFLELLSEEIPARMQARAAEDLARLVAEALAPLSPADIATFHGPRRLAIAASVARGVAESRSSERGPRRNAPEQALAGFLRKHGATREQLREEGDFWVLDRVVPGIVAADLIARELPGLLRRFPWPKSMRWGGTSSFTWVRPLRRILCILDGEVVPFDLREGEDDGHGLVSGNLTEGHRFLSPGAFPVASCAEWRDALRDHHVIVAAEERRRTVWEGITRLAAARDLGVVEDAGLLDEVANLLEWPVPLLGAIDAAYMDLPPEVMQVSMRVNQRYFALRDGQGAAAPCFAFAANVIASDGGRTIVAGNERVLRARFADARHFWDLDRTTRLDARVAALDGITFHAKLGTQGARVQRLVRLAGVIAPLVGADPALAQRAALLCKADLTTGMVGEFPELQGVMGRYYALHDNEDPAVADAIRDHYAPKGPKDAVPAAPVGIAVALADKLDTLAGFFAIGEKPTGSGDPYALRRAALGVIRIVREQGLRLRLGELIAAAGEGQPAPVDVDDLLGFLAERLRVQLRAEGARHDVLSAVLGTGLDDDLVRLLARTDAVTALVGTETGGSLLAACRRAANILRIEERKDGPHDGAVDTALLTAPEEQALASALDRADPDVTAALAREDFTRAMESLAGLRISVDAFFDKVTVNDPLPELRRNRLRLLSRMRAAMNRAADFSKIEG
ncbi:Glycine--tRNA ligase beta subunit [Rhodovastum atsumiense]|uniref:Glycine--tRNA ligase beta subunit n=1 Tax=Rhodovastum atsumiense TaxID=504468 RepID=A0A5M6ISL8_9PROT|nr:glycine--tRNA ligase subunit beta [Rhodovastum atsumiense]KAA5610889.1 glycine--tRNA ligase subunit beta [Rhodovastum atsumiense]CAH2601546.1 Glycine--tRNA ligase beta subunit [Rhodovastum atsumiense]